MIPQLFGKYTWVRQRVSNFIQLCLKTQTKLLHFQELSQKVLSTKQKQFSLSTNQKELKSNAFHPLHLFYQFQSQQGANKTEWKVSHCPQCWAKRDGSLPTDLLRVYAVYAWITWSGSESETLGKWELFKIN